MIRYVVYPTAYFILFNLLAINSVFAQCINERKVSSKEGDEIVNYIKNDVLSCLKKNNSIDVVMKGCDRVISIYGDKNMDDEVGDLEKSIKSILNHHKTGQEKKIKKLKREYNNAEKEYNNAEEEYDNAKEKLKQIKADSNENKEENNNIQDAERQVEEAKRGYNNSKNKYLKIKRQKGNAEKDLNKIKIKIDTLS